MTDSLSLIVNCLTVAFLFAWGAYERISAIRTGKEHPDSAGTDRQSLMILYITILLGYGVGIPVAFTEYGRITGLFPYLSFLGFVVIIAGLAVRLVAKKTLAGQFTYKVKIIDNHRLVTSGIYGRIRHPSYLGQSLIFLGCGIAFSNWIAILFLFLPNFIAALYRISIEEKVLAGHFADRYREYRAKTNALVPWIY